MLPIACITSAVKQSGSVPVNLTAPTITTAPVVGAAVAWTPGTWSGVPSLTYYVYQTGVGVVWGPGANPSSYIYTEANVGSTMYLRESDAVSSTYAESAVTAAVDWGTLLGDVSSPAAGASLGGTLDLVNNRYRVELTNTTWNPVTAYTAVSIYAAGNMVWLRANPTNCSLYITKAYSDLSITNNYFTPVAGAPYALTLLAGSGTYTVRKDGAFLGGVNLRRGATSTVANGDPVGVGQYGASANVTSSRIRVHRLEWANTVNLVMLGDSITTAQGMSTLGVGWFVSNHGVGYRQSRELANAVTTAFPGDRYNPTNYYADVVGMYRGSARKNIVIGGIGTNNIIHYNTAAGTGKGTPDGANTYGPEDGGSTAASVIADILTAIAAIKADNAGWKIAWRTPLQVGTLASGGAWATGETMRQAIRADIMSGSIRAQIDLPIDMDNLFCPAASRTDGVNADGAVYNASYWPQYAKNSAPYNPAMDGANIHPATATYTAIENYLGPLLATL